MNIEIYQSIEGMGSVLQTDFESFNLLSLISSSGKITFHWSNGNRDSLDGPIALYISEIKLWANRLISSEQEVCLELYMTPFLYGTRLNDEVELSYYSRKIAPEHDYGLIERVGVREINECVEYIDQKIAEYPE